MDATDSLRIGMLRFPMIVGVVFIHNYSTAVQMQGGVVGATQTDPVVDFVRSFISLGISALAVPLFFTISGYLFFLTYDGLRGFWPKLQRRLISLALPFVFWNLLVFLLNVVGRELPATAPFFKSSNFGSDTWYGYIDLIFGLTQSPIAYQFWFIRDLIVLVLLSPLFYWLLQRSPKIFVLVLFSLWAVNIWPIYIPRLPAIFFFVLGAALAVRKISMFSLDKYVLYFTIVYLPFVVVLTVTHGSAYLYNASILLGAPIVLYLTQQRLHSARTIKRLEQLGKASFFIFAAHEPLLSISKKLAYKIIQPSSSIMLLALYFLIPLVIILALTSVRPLIVRYGPPWLRLASLGSAS